MNNEDRLNILWLGDGSPPGLPSAFLQWSLRIIATTEGHLNSDSPDARALVIEFDGDIPKFIARVRRSSYVAWQHGLTVFLARAVGVDIIDFQRSVSAARLDPNDPARPIGELHLESIEGSLRALVDCSPGPSFRSLTRQSGQSCPEPHRFLLARAFSDFQRITVKRIGGGYSGAFTYAIYPHMANHYVTPFLAKIANRFEISRELDNYERLVRDQIPFSNRPELLRNRSCSDGGDSIMVEDFLDRAGSFKQLVKHGNSSRLVASLFDGALRGWRLAARVQKLRPVNYFLGKAVKYNTDLEQAATVAIQKSFVHVTARELIEILSQHPVDRCTMCSVHGDLHCGNIFVSAGSSDIFVIDFGSVEDGPAVADPACLEVDLSFNVARAGAQVLNALYRRPLQVPKVSDRVPGYEWLWEAVRAIRLLGGLMSSQQEYELAVACYMLRSARFPTIPMNMRALAVRYAAGLIL